MKITKAKAFEASRVADDLSITLFRLAFHVDKRLDYSNLRGKAVEQLIIVADCLGFYIGEHGEVDERMDRVIEKQAARPRLVPNRGEGVV